MPAPLLPFALILPPFMTMLLADLLSSPPIAAGKVELAALSPPQLLPQI